MFVEGLRTDQVAGLQAKWLAAVRKDEDRGEAYRGRLSRVDVAVI